MEKLLFLYLSRSLNTRIFSPVRNVGRSFNDASIEKMNCDVYGNECVGVFTILLSVSGEHKPPLQEHVLFCEANQTPFI